MITPAWCQTMAAYNAELNRRTYAAADQLTEAQRREDRGAFFGSIQATLSHLVWADHVWMSRFADWAAPVGGIDGSRTLFPEWAAMQAARIAADARIAAWTETLDAAWLAGSHSWFSGALGREMTQPTWLLVTHMFNHQTHHRGQVHALLTGFGLKTEATDLPFVL